MSENKNLFISFAVVGAVAVALFAYVQITGRREAALKASQQIESAEWSAGVKALIPSSLCPSYGYFLNCFAMEMAECRKRAVEVSHKCVDTVALEMPKVLQMPEDGRRFGARIAQCVDRSLEFQVRDRKKDREDCLEPFSYYRANPPPTTTKAQFMLELESELPVSLCEKQSYFRVCYLIDDEECATTAAKLVEKCLYDLEPIIPGLLQKQVDTGFWGARVGGCAGRAFEETFAANRIGSCSVPGSPDSQETNE